MPVSNEEEIANTLEEKENILNKVNKKIKKKKKHRSESILDQTIQEQPDLDFIKLSNKNKELYKKNKKLQELLKKLKH